MGKYRVFEIAKEFETTSKVIIDILGRNDIHVKNHMSSIDDSGKQLIAKTFERKAYELEEASGYWFPAEEFIPYKGLIVLIDKRRKHEI